MGSKKKKKKRKKFHDDFLRSLSSNQRWPRVATLFDFPRLIFNSQAKANIRSIRRIGQQSRGSLLDYVHDPFRMEGEGTGMDEFLQGQQESVSYERVARESCTRETGASIGITVDAGVIISSRSCLAGSRARAIYFLHGRIVNERVTRHTRAESRSRPPLFRWDSAFLSYPLVTS